MVFARRTLLEWALLALALAAFAGLAAWQDWFWRLDRSAYDVALGLHTHAVPDDVLIIAIDEESLARMGRWPWRRAVHATLLERLTQAGTRAVALDMVLTEPSADDAVLAAALRRNGHVVLPVVEQDFGPGLVAEGLPAAPLAQAAAALGHIGLELDADGIVRSVSLWAGAGAPRYPQLALALLDAAGQAAPGRAAHDARNADDAPRVGVGVGVGVGGSAGLWRHSGRIYPRFAGPPGSYHSVSYVDVLTGAVPDAALRGKLVLVGASAAGLGDAYPAPAVGGARLMPGVEWHATVLDNLRTRAAIVPVPRPVVTALAVLFAVAALLGQWLLAPRSGLLLALALALGVPLGATALLLWGGLWLPPAPLLLGGLLAYPLWSWRRLEAAQRFMDAELEALHAEMPAATPATTADLPHGPLEARLAILRAATAQQRAERQARKERLGFISHDLRAPLAAIVTLAERAQDLTAVQGVQDEGAAERDAPADADARLPAASQPALQLAGRYARNALDLADDLVRLGRAEAADPRRFAPVELAALADEAADAMWVQATARRVTLTTHYEGLEDATVPGDRALLRRALTNLLGNAITHSPPGSTVSVAVHADAGGFYRMDVTDQGAGIAPEQLPDLFTRYQRGGAEKDGGDESRGAGIGLGLLIVKTIAERHGGAVAVRSQPGAGSCFSMRLPAYHGPAYRGPG